MKLIENENEINLKSVFLLPCPGFLTSFGAAQDSNVFVGTYRIDLPGHTSIGSSTRNVGNNSVEITTNITSGVGAKGAGTLEIKADGTYRILDYLGLEKVKTGKWILNDEGPFSDRGGIELMDVKSADYGKDMRS